MRILIAFLINICLLIAEPASAADLAISRGEPNLPERLGWVQAVTHRCGGYYSEIPVTYTPEVIKSKRIEITSLGPVLFSKHGTSEMQGQVTFTQLDEQVTANDARLYRDPKTNKLIALDLTGNVHLREPDTLVLANAAHLDLLAHTQSLQHLAYRTTLTHPETRQYPLHLEKVHHVAHLSAWGQADSLTKEAPKIYVFQKASYSTCPPTTHTWQLKAEEVTLNRNTGRGVAKHARLYVQRVPILYLPYFNFPIDHRRQTGFLFPEFGNSNWSGPYLGVPFYWNMAPNYDMTITPTYMFKSGFQLADRFRYLTSTRHGEVYFSGVPNDKVFSGFQTQMEERFNLPSSTPVQIADLNRLQNAGASRGAIIWNDQQYINAHWSTQVHLNAVSDDYYLRNYRFNINETTQNQLLQEASLNYQARYWQSTLRLQSYQTLHPVDDATPTLNQYNRIPQWEFKMEYPLSRFGLVTSMSSELTHFDIRKTPGIDTEYPIGNRLHLQPGVSFPYQLPYFYLTPRLQLALTQYELANVGAIATPSNANRALPIFDVAAGLYFDRDFHLFQHALRQTLEPEVYYTYVPYRDQVNLPNFDTTLNTLNYEQIFTANRFSGLDRMGDANQIGLGVTTRFLDQETGSEKIRFGIGQIYYFKDRRVTLCTAANPNCLDASTLSALNVHRSPISAVFNYYLTPAWSLQGDSIWNTSVNEFDNQNITLTYAPSEAKSLSLGYNFVRQGDNIEPGLASDSSVNNLKQANLAFTWPLAANWKAIGRLTKSINRNYFQNLIYGIQYDSCCWAVRLVGGRVFSHLDPLDNNNPQYDKQFYVQFALRGLGNIGTGDPSQFVSSNTQHRDEFGDD